MLQRWRAAGICSGSEESCYRPRWGGLVEEAIDWEQGGEQGGELGEAQAGARTGRRMEAAQRYTTDAAAAAPEGGGGGAADLTTDYLLHVHYMYTTYYLLHVHYMYTKAALQTFAQTRPCTSALRSPASRAPSFRMRTH